MSRTPRTVLLIEDNPGDAVLVREALADDPSCRFRLVQAECLAAGLQRLEAEPVDAVLMDLWLPDSRGLATFDALHARAARVPIVVLSGLADEAVAVEAVRCGAQDYLVKGPATSALLTRTLRYALGRKRAEEQLRRAKEAAEAAGRTLGHLLAEVGRAARSPLNQIIGLADQLLGLRLDPAPQGHALAIRDDARALLALMERTLDLPQPARVDRRPLTRRGAAVARDATDGGEQGEAGDGPVTVLLIEDNPGDAVLVREALADEHPGRFRLLQVGRLAAGLQRLEAEPVNAVLLDLSLPDSRGLATFDAVHAQSPRVPIVVLSGLADEAVAVEAVRCGAQDYLVKGQAASALLGRALRHALGRKRAEEQLRRAKEAAETATGAREALLDDLGRATGAPLNRIISLADRLLAADLTLVQRCHVEAIRANADGLLMTLTESLHLPAPDLCYA
ncbi:MAG TPA: response regulator [Isosphaeraceae bacterium]